MSILIKNIDEIYTRKNKIEKGYILIKDNIIKEVGFSNNIDNIDNNYDKVIDAQGKIALPGLINTHTHAAMTLLRGYADDLPLQKWLEKKIWPFEAQLTENDIYWGTMLAIIEMISTGTTTFTDMYFQMDKVAEAVIESGIRAILSEGLIEANDGIQGLKKSVDFCNRWKNERRIYTMLAPHSIYTCSKNFLQSVISYSNRYELPINIHLAETKEEYDNCVDKYALSPVKYLDSIKLLDSPVIAAHCIYVSEEDINIISEKDVGVAYNPTSNMKLGSGIAPAVKMLNKNINVGLGTDGAASNNNLDMVEEARIGSYLQKADNLDPTAMDISTMLDMMTISGAKALRIDKLGKIKSGSIADIILVDITKESHFYPHHNNLSNLFYAGAGYDVDTVIVDGNILYQNKNFLTLDTERIYYEIKKIKKKKN
ncbi:MAG: amidohydrolase [bacterium]